MPEKKIEPLPEQPSPIVTTAKIVQLVAEYEHLAVYRIRDLYEAQRSKDMERIAALETALKKLVDASYNIEPQVIRGGLREEQDFHDIRHEARQLLAALNPSPDA